MAQPLTIDEILDPKHTALLVIDKQNGYMNRADKDVTHLKKTIAHLDDFIVACRKLEVPVIWTQMIENIDESPENIQSIIATDPEQKYSLTSSRDESFDFFGKVRPEKDELVIKKYHYDSFADTDLAKILKEKGIKTVILTGGYTSRCVLGTAYGANGQGLHIVIAKDLLGSPKEFEHEVPAMLSIVNAILGYPLDSAEILTRLRRDD